MNTLERYASEGNLDGVLRQLHNKRPQDIQGHNAILWAAENGHVDCVRALANAGLDTQLYEAMEFAARRGQLETLVFLSTLEDPKGNACSNSDPLYLAAAYGQMECLQFLLPLSDPMSHNSRCLMVAACNGQTECVAALLDVSDPRAKRSEALRKAVENRYADVVQLLLGKSNVNEALSELKDNDRNFLNEQIAVREKQMLENALRNDALPSPRKKL